MIALIIAAALTTKQIILLVLVCALFAQTLLAMACFYLLLRLSPDRKSLLVWNFVILLLIFIGPAIFIFYYLNNKPAE